MQASMDFARMLEGAGCSMLTVHGRTRGGDRHRRAGPADIAAINAIAAAVRIPVLSNGNVRCHADVHRNLAGSHCVGVMSGEGVLHSPRMLSCARSGCARRRACAGSVGRPRLT
ncbi:hypothetical protein EON66_06125 [archaeon]|nr:MAG: hypothetical protein EON66_06125 [archaeon]